MKQPQAAYQEKQAPLMVTVGKTQHLTVLFQPKEKRPKRLFFLFLHLLSSKRLFKLGIAVKLSTGIGTMHNPIHSL